MYFSEGDTGFFNNLIADGHLGVDLFFILSGFILTYVYGGDWVDGRFSYRGFLWNRFARVYPLHLFMIFLFIIAYQAAYAMGMSGFEGADYEALPFHIFAVHAWGFTDGHAWNFPSWSISAEFFAYLLVPVAFWVLMRQSLLLSMTLALFAFVCTYLFAMVTGHTLTKMMYNFGILRISGEFMIGIALCKLFQSNKVPVSVARPGLVIILGAILAGSLMQINESIIVLLLAAVIFFIAQLGLEEKGNFLRHPALVYLGEISYATYMVHILVIIAAEKVIPEPWRNTLTFIVIYVGSVCLYHLVELPARKMLRSFVQPRKSQHSA
jgi:peptidoglycan/LPS O-acetylase OafA/YrhL